MYFSRSLAKQSKKWTIFKVNDLSGVEQKSITLRNNPTFDYAELVIQPKTLLAYGLYKFVYSLSVANKTSNAYTYVKIVPSGLVLSSLKLSKGMYGGIIEISRGWNQTIPFNPFLNTFDIDAECVITTLTFKYTCRTIESFNQYYSTNTHLDEFKPNPCFNKSSM